MTQTGLQKYLMEDLLGIRTQFAFLVQKKSQTSETHRVLRWKDVFKNLDVSGLRGFMVETINALCAQAAQASS